MNTGKLGAYKQLTPVKIDLGRSIMEQEALNKAHFKEKEAKAEKEDLKQRGLSDQQALISSGKRTKFVNFDHAAADVVNRSKGLKEIYANAQQRYSLDPSDSQAKGIMTNVERSVQRLATSKNAILEYTKALSTGIAEGTYSKFLNQGYTSNMQKINEGQVEFEVDDYGNIKILNKGGVDGKGVDLDGDTFPDEITLENLSDKNYYGNWEKDADINSLNETLAKKYKTYKEVEINPDGGNPYLKRTKMGLLPENKLLVADDYRSVYGQDISSITNQGKSLLNQKGEDIEAFKKEPALYKKFITKLANDFEQSQRKENSDDIDGIQKRSDQAAKLAAQEKKDLLDGNDDFDDKGIKISTDENDELITGYSDDENFHENMFTVPKTKESKGKDHLMVTDGSTNKILRVTHLGFLSNGDMYYNAYEDVSVSSTDTGSSTAGGTRSSNSSSSRGDKIQTTEGTKDKVLGDISLELEFDTLGDMVKHLKQIEKNHKSKSEKNENIKIGDTEYN